MFILVLLFLGHFTTSICAQLVTLSLRQGLTACVVNETCQVDWVVQGDVSQERRFFIVKDRHDLGNFPGGLGDDPREVRLDNGKADKAGSVLIKFAVVAEYDLIAFDKRTGEKNYEGEWGRLKGILIQDKPEADPFFPSGASTGAASDSSSITTSPTASVPTPAGGPTLAVERKITETTEEGAKRTAIIVGSVLAGAIGLCLIVILIWLFVIRPRRRKQDYASNLSIFFNSRKSASTHAESGLGVGSPYAWPSPSEKSSGMVDNGHSPNPSTCDSITPLKSPRPRSAGSVSTPKKTFSFPSIFTEATPPVRFAPLTDRQMDLQERVHNLKSQLIATREDSDEFEGLMKRIDLLERLHKSDWALEKTDDIPPGLFE